MLRDEPGTTPRTPFFSEVAGVLQSIHDQTMRLERVADVVMGISGSGKEGDAPEPAAHIYRVLGQLEIIRNRLASVAERFEGLTGSVAPSGIEAVGHVPAPTRWR